MLIRPGGGRDGIKEYLERGQKAGRELGRDRLDERVVLDGNLVRTNQIIQSIDSVGERYLHFTLGFREDHVSPEILAGVVMDFKALAFSAFRDDEFGFYAEAHLPRVKSVVNNSTGEFMVRKPHIHVVIPNKNLLSGRALNPFGKVSHHLLFIDAIQEHINSKYGLESPKNHRRGQAEVNSESQIIARYKVDDQFARSGDAKEKLRSALLSSIILHDPRTMVEFKKLVAMHGVVGVANPGRQDEYLKVKLRGASSWTRLKDREFTRECIEPPLAQKRVAVPQPLDEKQGTGTERSEAVAIESRLLEWREVRAKQAKYIKSGSTKRYAEYRRADRDTQLSILAHSEANFYTKWDALREKQQQQRRPLERVGANLGAAGRHLEAAGGCHESLNRVARVASDRSVIRALGTVIQRHQIHSAQPSAFDLCTHHRPADHVAGQLLYEARELEQQRRVEARLDTGEINRTIDATGLLATLAASHGVIAARYRINKGKDGGDRIGVGTFNLKPSDFLAKHLHLPWADAEPILRREHARQCGQASVNNVPTEPASSSLWTSFQAWKIEFADRGRQELDSQRASEKDRRGASAAAFQTIRLKIGTVSGLPSAERRAAISIARMQKVQADKALSEAIRSERQSLRSRYSIRSSELFRVYLQQLANIGNVTALIELRRQRIEPEVCDSAMPQLVSGSVGRNGVGNDGFVQCNPALTYRVERNGDVTYRIDHQDVLRDEIRAVKFLTSNDPNGEAMEIGLRLALQKFGPKIAVKGDDEFKRRIVRTAVEARLRVEFTDPALNRYRQRLEAERKPTTITSVGSHASEREHSPSGDEREGEARAAETLKESSPTCLGRDGSVKQADPAAALVVMRGSIVHLRGERQAEGVANKTVVESEHLQESEDEVIDAPRMQ